MLNFIGKVRKSRVGYTLTELIVVVAILGILAAIGIPMVLQQVQNSKVGADKGTASAIETAVQLALGNGHLEYDATSNLIKYKAPSPAITGITDLQSAIKYEMAGRVYPNTQQDSTYKWFLDVTDGKVYAADPTAAVASANGKKKSTDEQLN
jgi:prepilin-type N-terminal cleavage/methylation domain-containing protein